MKRFLVLLLTLLMAFGMVSCKDDDNSAAKGEALQMKELFGTYVGSGSVTKKEVTRTQTDIDNQRYLFITGDKRETESEFSDIIIEFEEVAEEDTIRYNNKLTGSSGELIYNSASGQWEYMADYTLGTVSSAVIFSKDKNGIHANFVFTQSFEREHYENPEPSDGVNEFTIYLTKTK